MLFTSIQFPLFRESLQDKHFCYMWIKMSRIKKSWINSSMCYMLHAWYNTIQSSSGSFQQFFFFIWFPYTKMCKKNILNNLSFILKDGILKVLELCWWLIMQRCSYYWSLLLNYTLGNNLNMMCKNANIIKETDVSIHTIS